MPLSSIALIVLFALLASLIQRVSGFGFGIFIMTVLPHLLPSYAEATALSGLLAIVASLGPAVVMYRHLEWKKLLPILITFIVVSFFFVRLIAHVDNHALKQVLGAFLILVSLYFFFVSGRIHLPPTVPVQIGMGTLSGALGGLFAMQGPPAVIYFVESCKSKEEYIAATQWYFLIGNAAMSLFRADSGFVTPVVLRCWCFAMPAVLAGMWIGSHIYKRIRLPLLRKVVYAYMALAGLLSIIL